MYFTYIYSVITLRYLHASFSDDIVPKRAAHTHTHTRWTKILPLISPSAYDSTVKWVHHFHQGKHFCAFTKEMLLQIELLLKQMEFIIWNTDCGHTCDSACYKLKRLALIKSKIVNCLNIEHMYWCILNQWLIHAFKIWINVWNASSIKACKRYNL